MSQNIQNNYKNYSLTQEQVLYSIVNTTNRDIDIIASAMQLSKMTGNQNFYIYNQTDDVFEIYCDKEENINDTFIKNALINNETICVDYENNEKVLSSIQIKIKDKNYCLGLATNTEYINNNYNNSMYNMFIILEFVILYVILIIISLALYGIDKRYKTKIEQINNNLKEYENKIDLNTDAKGNISAKEQKTYTEGVYDVSFYEKLKKKLIDNNIAFNIAKYEIKESLEDKIVEMLKDKNAYLVKDFNNYIVLSINDKDICMNEIINLGGKYVG